MPLGWRSWAPDAVFGARSLVDALVRAALNDAIAAGVVAPRRVPGFAIEAPRYAAFGDLACDVAIVLGRQLGASPQAIGEAIASRVRDPAGWVAEVTVGGPGFVNFRFAPSFWHTLLGEALDAGDAYGRSDAAVGRRVGVALMVAGNSGTAEARALAVGDSVARLLRDAGARVERIAPATAPESGPLDQLIQVVAGDRPCIEEPEWPVRTLRIGSVRLTRDGSPVRDVATMRELLEEIGPDGLRFLLLLGRTDRLVEVDVELAKRECVDNPLFAVHCAHARLAGRARAGHRGIRRTLSAAELALLDEGDIEVLRAIAGWPDVVDLAVRALEPDRVARFAVDLAVLCQRWLNRQGRRATLDVARGAVAACLAQVLRRALALCEVTAPERV
jgi:arginyl-tRNA synthetase